MHAVNIGPCFGAFLYMRTFRQDIDQLLINAGGVISRRDHPELGPALDWLVRTHELSAVLPGVYAPRSMAASTLTRIRAAAAWSPDLVLTGPAAASVSFWPSVPVSVVTAAVPTRRSGSSGFAFSRRIIPVDLIEERHGLRYTSPALTALDLCELHDGNGIDRALRTRTATLEGMRCAMALQGKRLGNPLRRRLLLDSRDEPWSAAERLAHRLLREAKITGWNGNLAVRCRGHLYYLDIAFEGSRLVIEIDGRLHEDDPAVFENDRLRQNDLAVSGWQVLRFTWRMLVDDPDYVMATILAALELSRP